VAKDQVDDVLPQIKSHLAVALEYFHNLYEIEDIRQDLKNGHKQLWLIGDNAAIITQIEIFPRGKVLRVFSASGEDRGKWLGEADSFCDALARANDCSVVIANGRRGWSKDAANAGWTRFNEYRKELV
jgi:hypothetical protein